MKRRNLKTGSAVQVFLILLFVIISLTLIAVCTVTQFYITSRTLSVKRDLFYIGQDAAKSALNAQKLSYLEYEVDEKIMQSVANTIIESNYNGEVKLEKISFSSSEKSVYIKVTFILNSPIGNRILSIPLEETMKLKLMEVE